MRGSSGETILGKKRAANQTIQTAVRLNVIDIYFCSHIQMVGLCFTTSIVHVYIQCILCYFDCEML